MTTASMFSVFVANKLENHHKVGVIQVERYECGLLRLLHIHRHNAPFRRLEVKKELWIEV